MNIVLTPTSGKPGDTIKVHGTGWDWEGFTLYFDGLWVARKEATTEGVVDAAFTVPAGSFSGLNDVAATSRDGAVTASLFVR